MMNKELVGETMQVSDYDVMSLCHNAMRRIYWYRTFRKNILSGETKKSLLICLESILGDQLEIEKREYNKIISIIPKLLPAS